MRPIEINSELGLVKEKFYGYEARQIADVVLAGITSFGIYYILPDIGVMRGIISTIPALPFIMVAVVELYGLKGLKLGKAFFISVLNDKPLSFKSDYVKEGLNGCKDYSGKEKKLS